MGDFDNCAAEPIQCSIQGKEVFTRMSWIRFVCSCFYFAAYVVMIAYTFWRIKGQKYQLLLLQTLLAISSSLQALAFSSLNERAVNVLVLWQIKPNSLVYAFPVVYYEVGYIFYFSIVLFCLCHWQFSYFYLQTAVQLVQKKRRDRCRIPRVGFVLFNLLMTIMISLVVILAGTQKTYEVESDDFKADKVLFWEIFPLTVLSVPVITFGIALLLLFWVSKKVGKINMN